eukprot:5635676-Pyramimonas_sp.AAC.1
MGFDIELGDISSAFMNGHRYQRKQGPLYCELPADGAPGAEPGSLLEVLVCVYGLGDAPLQWYKSFTTEALAAGFKISSYDPCLLDLHQDGKYRGSIALAVDDTCGGGDEYFQRAMEKIKR